MPKAPDPITSPPARDFQPYDATAHGPVSGWDSVDENSGPADRSGNAAGDFNSGSGWSQT